MELKPEQLAAQLGSGPLRTAYLIAGPEPLRVLEAADAIRAAARAQGIGEREIFEAEGNQREPDWSAMEASFRSPSLFSSKRLMEVRLPSGKPGTEGGRLIAEFCAQPPSDITLLVTCGDWSRQHGGKWSEAIARVGQVAIAWPIKPHELPGWIEQRLRSRGLKAERDAVQRLADRVEGNLLAAAQEIEKLKLLADGEVITAARMDDLVADAARFDVFRLMDAAMNGQAAQVARVLRGLRGEGEAVPALLGMVIRELQTVASLARAGNLATAFKSLRVWDSKQPMYRRALQRHEPARWDGFLAQAGRVDAIAKGRPRRGVEPDDAWVALERLLLAVAEPRAARLLAAAT
ncbi:DNA polymerase III subunit delta [Agrilutibacter solisilvae]|uniref:DNA polymerase III subunit delta n=1 Tax=Agrilutibacter solisilvae TaxID=2763317 RepID=A0A974XYJ6_9GAMM|nr:DNA polymerase III subunit delta [Lysobacter solisilvae]QSX77220.1 DNA polymerase III subunit delta [Lysobacter solisilvae]